MMLLRLWASLSLPLLHLLNLAAAQDALEDDSGLFSFVTRPDLRAPKLAVRVVNKTAVSPGYHFVAPYNTNNDWKSHKTPLIEACQVGPHIYDSNGELIWSGACLFRNENGFDFKAIHYANKTYLSLDNVRGDPSLYGAGIILSDQYKIIKDVQMAEHTNQFDQHEFAVVQDGKRALYSTSDLRDMDGDSIGLGRNSQTRVHSTGFKEVDISGENPKTIFDWQGADHVPLEESTFAWPEEADPYGKGWDYLHINSVDKFPNGDYLVSFRYTNSLMRLSGGNGHVLWRLGGKRSDFDTKDFVFSRQHHGRIITSNETHTVLSFVDNASSSQISDKGITTADRSSARVIRLSHDPHDRGSWTATPLRHFERPDWGYTRLRGSIQILPSFESSSLEHDTTDGWTNSNAFISWSDHGYATEFSPNGDVVMETQFVSRRFDTYRAFKMVGFVGRPTEPPALKALVYGDILPGQGSGVGPFTVVYISWNGATEVRVWRVYGKIVKDAAEPVSQTNTSTSVPASASPTSEPSRLFRFARSIRSASGPSSANEKGQSQPRSARLAYLGTYRKTGFETAITVPGAVSYLWAEALDSEGNKIGQTSVARGIVPGVTMASWEEAESTNASAADNSSSSSSASDLWLDFDTDADAAAFSTDLTLSESSSPFFSSTEDPSADVSPPIVLAPLTFPSAFPHGWGYGDTEAGAKSDPGDEAKSWWESYGGSKYELTVSRNTAAIVVGAVLVLLLCLLAALVWTGLQMWQLRKRRRHHGATSLPLAMRRRGQLSHNSSTSSLGSAAPSHPGHDSGGASQGAQRPWWRAAFPWRPRRPSSRYEPVVDLDLDLDEEEIDMDTWDDVGANVPLYQPQPQPQPQPRTPQQPASRRTASASFVQRREMAHFGHAVARRPLQGHDLGAGGMRMAGGHVVVVGGGASASASASASATPLPLICQIAERGAKASSSGAGEQQAHQAAWWPQPRDQKHGQGQGQGQEQEYQQGHAAAQRQSQRQHKRLPGRYKRGRSFTTEQAEGGQEGWVTHRHAHLAQHQHQHQQQRQQQQQQRSGGPGETTANKGKASAAADEKSDEDNEDDEEGWGGSAGKRTTFGARGRGAAGAIVGPAGEELGRRNETTRRR